MMQGNRGQELLQAVFYTIIRITGLLLVYFVTAPAYYGMLDALFNATSDIGGADLTGWAQWVYLSFYYGYPSLFVFGCIISVLYLYLLVRRRYYSTEEVSYY
jgi:hypothetical protein